MKYGIDKVDRAICKGHFNNGLVPLRVERDSEFLVLSVVIEERVLVTFRATEEGHIIIDTPEGQQIISVEGGEN